MGEKQLSLHNLQPAQERKERKRVGRGLGSGKGRYSGRGLKGQKSRSGSHNMRPGFEGGQNPIYMRMAKQRGATSKDAMPIGPFMTYSQPVNLAALQGRFEAGAEVTPETLKAAGLIRKLSVDVKILGNGELSKKLSITAHRFSKTAVEKIEAAGGTVTWLRGPEAPEKKSNKRRNKNTKKPVAAEAAESADEATASDATAADTAPDTAVAASDSEA